MHHVSKRLIRYRLKWQLDEITLEYGVFRDGTASQYMLSEELSAYKDLLRTAERSL
ncbi:hypothetical protein [Marinoscillum furvescens]|uniref:Uncharacterized protein n=1 Tax=Marinoscillum furvescens DSM 4134 TaxID=1122208 RepID=A0A3D9L4V9_MARFU|nr:hypothetical protein [Marinoscillum furvescens]RED99444.1 hypothetical protein C7460_10860 [Marinoscillum furvescens DSM 4134]